MATQKGDYIIMAKKKKEQAPQPPEIIKHKSIKRKPTNNETLQLCAQAISDAKKEIEFLYNHLTGDFPLTPKTIKNIRREVKEELSPRLSMFERIEHDLKNGRTDIQISKNILDGADWKLGDIRQYLRYLKIASESDIPCEAPTAFIDSIGDSINYRITILDEVIADLKEVFGGSGWKS